jgi:hypothetical protein
MEEAEMGMEGGDVDAFQGGQMTGGFLPYSYEDYDLGSSPTSNTQRLVNSSLRCNTLDPDIVMCKTCILFFTRRGFSQHFNLGF